MALPEDYWTFEVPPSAPITCYEICNMAYIEAQKLDMTLALCSENNFFSNYYSACRMCVETLEASPIPSSTATPTDENPQNTWMDLTPLSPYIEYCNIVGDGSRGKPRGRPAIPSFDTQSISYYATIVTSVFMATVLPGSITTTEAVTITLPIANLPILDTEDSARELSLISDLLKSTITTTDVATSSSTTLRTTVSPDPRPTTPTNNTDETPSNIPGRAVEGIALGVILAVVLLAAIITFFYMRYRKHRRLRDGMMKASHSYVYDSKPQLHGDSLDISVVAPQEMDPIGSHRPAELEGSQDRKGCHELDSSMVHAELEAPQYGSKEVGETDLQQAARNHDEGKTRR